MGMKEFWKAMLLRKEAILNIADAWRNLFVKKNIKKVGIPESKPKYK